MEPASGRIVVEVLQLLERSAFNPPQIAPPFSSCQGLQVEKPLKVAYSIVEANQQTVVTNRRSALALFWVIITRAITNTLHLLSKNFVSQSSVCPDVLRLAGWMSMALAAGHIIWRL